MATRPGARPTGQRPRGVALAAAAGAAGLGCRRVGPTVLGMARWPGPKGSNTGDVLRLRGKGVARKGAGSGDQRVVLKVVMPDRVDPDLAEFLERWRKGRRDDPRAALRRET